VIPSGPGFLETAGKVAVGTLPWLIPIVLGGTGIGASGIGVALAWKVGKSILSGVAKRGHSGEANNRAPPPAYQLPQRDETEARQILSLRSKTEERSPVHDALFGVLIEDEARENPNRTIREVLSSVTERFNQIAPLSIKGNK
jgi:hypothetical protein